MFSVEARVRAIRAMLGGPLYLGLATGVVDGALREVMDLGYARRQLTSMVEDGARMTNADEVMFPPWKQDADGQVRHWFICGENGVLLASGELPRRRDGWLRPLAGDTVRLAPGDIVLEVVPATAEGD